MSDVDRRSFIGAVSLGSLAGLPLAEQMALAAGQDTPGAPASGVTRALAQYIVPARPQDLPAPVRKEAQRTLLNWVGCAVGGSRHETLDARDCRARAVFRPAAGVGPRPPGTARHPSRLADERHQLARVRLRRHAPQDGHPSRRARSRRRCSRWPNIARCRARLSPCAWSSASKRSAGSGTRSTRRTTIAAGTSRAPPACSARPRRAASCSGCPSSRWSGRSASLRPSRSACARCSASMTKSFHPGRAAQNGLTAALLASRELHQHRRRHRRQERLGERAEHHARLRADHGQPREDLRDLAEHLQAVRLRHRHSPGDRRVHPAAATSTRSRLIDRAHRSRACIRWCSS